MSERKVLNKYYPPDFDPSKLPKLRQSRDRQYTVRIMAPFNMQCKTCGEYIYKGKKFNAKTENVTDQSYLGLRIYRFYIKCPKCISEINFKTDPENTDYTLEHGATRLFEASKAYQKQEEQEKKDKEEEEANNPMKVLENRTKDSKLEMEVIENLEELRDLKARHADINYADILKQKAEDEEAMLRKQEEDDEAEIRKHFGQTEGGTIKRLLDPDDDDEPEASPSNRSNHSNSSSRSHKRPTDFLTEDSPGVSPVPSKKQKSWDVSVGALSSSKSALAGLVKVKKTSKPSVSGEKSTEPLLQHSASSSSQSESRVTSVPSHNLDSQSTSVGQKDAGSKSEAKKSNDGEGDEESVGPLDSAGIMSSIREGLVKQQGKQSAHVQKRGAAKSGGLSLLGGYADSDDSGSSNSGDDEA